MIKRFFLIYVLYQNRKTVLLIETIIYKPKQEFCLSWYQNDGFPAMQEAVSVSQGRVLLERIFFIFLFVEQKGVS